MSYYCLTINLITGRVKSWTSKNVNRLKAVTICNKWHAHKEYDSFVFNNKVLYVTQHKDVNRTLKDKLKVMRRSL